MFSRHIILAQDRVEDQGSEGYTRKAKFVAAGRDRHSQADGLRIW